MADMEAMSFLRKVLDRVQLLRATEYPTIDLCKKVFSFYGSWHPDSSQSWFSKVCRYFLPRLALYISVYGFFVGHPWLAYQSKGNDIHLAVESASAIFMASMMSSIFVTLLYRPNQLESLFSALEAIKECSLKLTERPASLLQENRKMGEYLLRFLVCSLSGLALSLVGVPMLYKKRKLVFYHWYPFDHKASPAYEIVLVYTTLAHIVGMSTLIAFYSMIMALCLEARGQFLLLSHNLASINNVGRGKECQGNFASNESADTSPENSIVLESATTRRDPREEIKVCVDLHLAITRFVGEVEATFNIHLGLYLICTLVPSGMCILLLFFDESNEKTVQYFFLVMGSNMGLAILCWLGNELTIQDEAVREAVYESDWFDQSESFKRSMRIIMSRSNQPVVVRVAGFVTLSIETYHAMTKMTYSYIMTMWVYFQESRKT